MDKNKDKAFMAQHSGKPCAICKRSMAMGRASAGHHIIEKSTHPEYRYSPENIITLCPVHHMAAHDSKRAFMNWLQEKRPAQFKWVAEHQHHRKEG